jgi:hypothetical protein
MLDNVRNLLMLETEMIDAVVPVGEEIGLDLSGAQRFKSYSPATCSSRIIEGSERIEPNRDGQPVRQHVYPTFVITKC